MCGSPLPALRRGKEWLLCNRVQSAFVYMAELIVTLLKQQSENSNLKVTAESMHMDTIWRGFSLACRR